MVTAGADEAHGKVLVEQIVSVVQRGKIPNHISVVLVLWLHELESEATQPLAEVTTGAADEVVVGTAEDNNCVVSVDTASPHPWAWNAHFR